MLTEGNDWIKNGDGTYTVEEGDSVWSLHTQHDVGAKEVNDAIEAQHGENYKGDDGEIKSNIDKDDVVVISSETKNRSEKREKLGKAMTEINQSIESHEAAIVDTDKKIERKK